MSESRHDEQSRIPSWNGDPSTWTSFSDEVKLWRLSENMEVNFSLASRLVRQLSGSARRAVAKLPADELHPPYVAIPGKDLDPSEKKAWRNNTGIDNVMAKLLKDLGQQKPVRKGQSLHEFFGTPKYQRRRGERVTDWLTRFEEGLTKLREDDIDLLELEDVAGWFLLFRAGLTPERKERIIGTLPDEHFPFEPIKRSLIRLFPEMHALERSAHHTHHGGHSSRQNHGVNFTTRSALETV